MEFIETDFIVGGLEHLQRLHQFLHKSHTKLIENKAFVQLKNYLFTQTGKRLKL